HVLMQANGSLAAVSGTLLPATTKPSFASSPSDAVNRALDQQYGASRPPMTITPAGDNGGWQTLQVASTGDLQVSSTRARQVLASQNGQLAPAWEVEIEGDARPDPNVDPSFPTF